ncbi:MAG: hypothetical protein M1814_003440 [Vezdaea aestivalis]|nr:MAG: hypothetical protein M1814_003440 [Vezdaea aestivalis]
MAGDEHGVAAGHINANPPTYMAIAAFTAVAWFNVIELNSQIFLTFKRHRGLYFWSLLISSWGVVLHALGFILKFFQLANVWFTVSLITVGWYAMVTGQSVVLYSRLHLVVRDHKILRGVLIMICVDAFLFHTPTTVLTFGSNRPSPLDDPLTKAFTHAFNIMEKIQMTAFCIQEFIISGLYVWATLKLLKPIYHGRTRKVMTHLIWINIIIVALDVVLLAMEYKNYYEIQATLKAMVYSIKLKLEFAVLNQLMTLANAGVHDAALRSHHTHDEPNYRRTASVATQSAQGMASVTPPNTHIAPDFNAAAPVDPSIGHTTVATRMQPKHPLWTPTLDRNCIVKTQHVEISSATKKDCEEAVRTGTGLTTATINKDGSQSLMGTTIVAGKRPPSKTRPALKSTRPSVEDFGTGADDSDETLAEARGRARQETAGSNDRWERRPSVQEFGRDGQSSESSSEVRLAPYMGDLDAIGEKSYGVRR